MLLSITYGSFILMWLSSWAIALLCVVGIVGGLTLVILMRRRNTLQQLLENETRLKLSLWASGDLLWDWQVNTPNLFCQNDWLLIKQFPHDGIRQQQAITPIHEHDAANVRDQLMQHLNGHTELFEATYRVRDNQGHWRWLLDRGKVVERDIDDEPVRMTGTIKDVHELVVAQERVRLFAASFTNISDGVCIYDHEFNAVEVNDAFVAITGIDRKSVV